MEHLKNRYGDSYKNEENWQVFYTYKGIKKKYVINSKNIIKDTQWENLKNTKDNRLTLITCVENQPEYRRCIQAIELNEEGRIE